MSAVRTRVSPITAYVRNLPQTYYLLNEVALMLGVHDRTLRVLNGDPETFRTLGPTSVVRFGKVTVYLYTPEDVEKLKKHFANRRKVEPAVKADGNPGRPRKYDAEQKKVRGKLYSRAHYYRQQLKKPDVAASPKRVREYNRKLKETQRELIAHERAFAR